MLQSFILSALASKAVDRILAVMNNQSSVGSVIPIIVKIKV